MNKNSETVIDSSKNNETYEQVFEDWFESVEKLFPNLGSDMKSFNDTNVGIKDYQQYISLTNLPPASISTNSIG